ncbi:MAG: hypothetical protein WAW88_00575 [Nocardioides sp.]
MCHRKKCRKCGKVTWGGCGAHVQQVMAGVPKQDRCDGHQNEPREPGFFARLFNR